MRWMAIHPHRHHLLGWRWPWCRFLLVLLSCNHLVDLRSSHLDERLCRCLLVLRVLCAVSLCVRLLSERGVSWDPFRCRLCRNQIGLFCKNWILRGVFVVLFGILFMTLMGAAAISVDFARIWTMRNE